MTRAFHIKLNVSGARIVLVVIYLVGVLGFSWHVSAGLFKQLTGITLLLSAMLMFWFHQSWSVKQIFVLLGVALIGFGAELLGVNYGLLFGHYNYGASMGPQWKGTPLLIGLNWLVLAYGIYAFFPRMRLAWHFPLWASALMVVFDLVMEPVAVHIGLWGWQGNLIPLKNYLDWYLVSLLIFYFLRFSRIPVRNQLAAFLWGVQFFFFVLLGLIYRLY